MKTKNTERFTQLQGRLATVAMISGIGIACVCLFVVPPPGEISTSAITVVSELLIVSGALLGIKVSFDVKLKQFMAEMEDKIRREQKEEQNEE